MAIIDRRDLTFLKEPPHEIIISFFRESEPHYLNKVDISLFRTRLIILFLLLVIFKVITNTTSIWFNILNVLLIALLGIVLIEGLIRLFHFYVKVAEKRSLTGIVQFIFIFLIAILVLGVV